MMRILLAGMLAACLALSNATSQTDPAVSVYDSLGNRSVYTVNDSTGFIFQRPRSFTFFRNYWSDNKEFFKTSFQKKNIPLLLGIAGSTALFIVYDQAIVDAAQDFGRTIGTYGKDGQHAAINFSLKLGGNNIKLPVYLPTQINSGMYFIGDGLFHLSVIGGFWGYGAVAKDNRARQTASQIFEAMFASGVIVQVIKHTTGRECPFTADKPGGVWRFFPNQSEYSKHVPNYDAFPTGHLCSAMAAFVVITENYPEKKWIQPVGYSLMTLLGYSMLNNGVHWISDYPLGIAIGYGFGKIAARKGKQVLQRSNSSSGLLPSGNKKFSWQPVFNPVYGTAGVRLTF